MTKLESEIQSNIIEYMKAQGHYCVRVSMSNVSGVPDLFACVKPKGVFLAIEVKEPLRGRVSCLQSLNLERVRDAGGVSCIATSVDDVINALTEIRNRTD